MSHATRVVRPEMQPSSFLVSLKSGFSGLQPVFGALAVLLLIAGLLSVAVLGWPHWKPKLQHVEIVGDLQFLDPDAVVSEVQSQISLGTTGMLSLDLVGLQNHIQRLPWVASVRLYKQFPSTLILDLEEAKAVARFEGVGYISEQGRMINSAPLAPLNHLPRVSGANAEPDHQMANDILALFHLVNSAATTVGHQVELLERDVTGGWSMQWDNQLHIKLGRSDHFNRLKRVMTVWRALPMEERARLTLIDGRYDQGAAVRLASNLKNDRGRFSGQDHRPEPSDRDTSAKGDPVSKIETLYPAQTEALDPTRSEARYPNKGNSV